MDDNLLRLSKDQQTTKGYCKTSVRDPSHQRPSNFPVVGLAYDRLPQLNSRKVGYL